MGCFSVLIAANNVEEIATLLAPYFGFDEGKPNVRWDWWGIGGRFTGLLPLKVKGVSDEDVAQGIIGRSRHHPNGILASGNTWDTLSIDWGPVSYFDWEVLYKNGTTSRLRILHHLENGDWDDPGSTEHILKGCGIAPVFAFVGTDGKWIARARMYAFAYSDNLDLSYEGRFWRFIRKLEKESPDQRVYLLVCHI